MLWWKEKESEKESKSWREISHFSQTFSILKGGQTKQFYIELLCESFGF